MKDIDDEELRMIERGSQRVNSEDDKMNQEQMIAMVDRIKKGENPYPQQSVQPKFLEPDAPKMQIPTFNQHFASSNYWKIDGLPSKGRFYADGTELLGRPMKVLEVKKISSITEDNGDFILNDIVRRTTTGIDVNDLYVADKLYIIFWLRANTFRESGYIVPFICPKCGKKSDYHFEIDKLEVQQLSDDFNPSKEIKIGSSVITYDYLRVKDELFIDRFKELNSQAVGEIDDEILAMVQMIKTIDGKEKTLLEKYHWMIELNPGDYSYFKTYVEKKGMGIKPFVMVECKECGGTASIAVSFREDFIIPEYKFE